MKLRRAYSPSFGISMPSSTCWRTTCLIPERIAAAERRCVIRLVERAGFHALMISRVRIRLPTCVVRMRSMLRFMPEPASVRRRAPIVKQSCNAIHSRR